MVQAIVGRWGNNLAIRLPTGVARVSGLSDGERVEIDVVDGAVIIHRADPRFSLGELFEGKSASEWRSAYSGAFEWGPDVGREVVED